MKFNVLDSFRGICALFVVLFHLRIYNTITETDFFRQSHFFVEFFFVLSGFVIAHSCFHKKENNFAQFMWRRIFRIFPLHIFVLVLFLVYEFIKYQASLRDYHFEDVFFSLPNYLEILVYNFTLTMSWVKEIPINGPSWSISVEFALYIIFGLIVSLVKSYKAFMVVIFTVAILSIIALVNFEYFDNRQMYRGLSCFFVGAITYHAFIHFHQKLENKKSIVFTCLEAISLIAVYLFISNDFMYKYAMCLFLFSSVVFIFAFEKGFVSTLFKNKVSSFLGTHSYSIYIIHYLILNFLAAVFMLFFKSYNFIYVGSDGLRIVDFHNIYFNNFYLVTVLALTLICSLITYRYIEFPFNQLGRRMSTKQVKINAKVN